MHASRSVHSKWQNLKPGDRVDDYGFSADDYFIVEDLHAEKYLVYKSERYGALFSWSLILHSQNEDQTLLHLRFRGKIAATGVKRRLIVWGGGWMDHLSIRPVRCLSQSAPSVYGTCLGKRHADATRKMLAGLAERAEKAQ